MTTLTLYWSLIVGAGFAVAGVVSLATGPWVTREEAVHGLGGAGTRGRAALGVGGSGAPGRADRLLGGSGTWGRMVRMLDGSGARDRSIGAIGAGLELTGVLLLMASALSAVHRDRLAQTVLALGGALVLPLVLVRIAVVSRGPGSRRLIEAALLVAGAASVLGAALGSGRLGVGAAVTGGVVLFCAGWLQFELSSGDVRRQVLWLVLGVGFAVPATWLFVVAADYIPVNAAGVSAIAGLLCLPVPLTAGLALTAPRAADVRFVISRSVVLIVMVTASVAVFAGAMALLQLWQGHRPAIGVLALIATVLAALFHPVLARVQISMDELLFGGRADPVATLARLGSQLTAGASPQEWLDMLRRALAVPAVVLRQDGAVIAGSGDPGGATLVVTPLQVGATTVGELVVALPDEQLRLSSTTQAVLGLVAAPLAQALQAARLNEQVQASRGRVVSALEEERRRVRRDLHDGLGPTLTGIAYSADAAANLIDVDAAQAAGLLRELRSDAGEAIAEVRRIVYGLRPRALDELGLVGAVRQRVSRLGTPDGRALTVQIVAPGELRDLPAVVEVVAYRVAVEAAANVARHARVATARIEFALLAGDELVVSVDDGETGAGLVVASTAAEGMTDGTVQGAGVSRDTPGRQAAANGKSDAATVLTAWTFGVGLTSMRERVEQIGGVLEAGATGSGGRVRARIPVRLPDGFAAADGPAGTAGDWL